MADPEQPLDTAGYLQILRNVTHPEYYEPFFEAKNAGADRVYFAMARSQAKFASHIYKAIESRYFRTHSTSTAEPAITWQYARGKVRLKRTTMLYDPRFVDAPSGGTVGAMILRGPSGRLYTNEESIEWTALDPVNERDVTFRCTVPGVVGNLDFYADEGGLITLEAAAGVNSEPDPVIIGHANLSDQRAGKDATIVPPTAFNRPSMIRDSGRPDQFSGTHKGLYVEILDAVNPENIGRFLRILDVLPPSSEIPIGSGLFPATIQVDDLPELKPLYRAKLDDGGVFTDYTVEADDNNDDDVPLAPLVPVVNDAFYFGFAEAFLGVAIAITTPATGEWSVVWEYYDGALWQPYLGIVDESQSFHVAGEVRVEAPSLPVVWSTVAVDGVVAFWVRARVDAVVSTDAQAFAAKVKAIRPNRLTVESGAVAWAVRDWRELGIAITRVEAFAGGRDNDLGALAEERGITPQDKESDESLRRRVQELADVVTPAAIRQAVNRQLAPFNLQGKAIDVQNGLTGLFSNVDFGDYYEAGDPFPVDKQKLIDTDSICYGWFLVFVPYLADGEFGGFADEGPVIWLEKKQTFLASAADLCFVDGFPVDANGVYQSIWEQVNAIRAFGVGFTILRSAAQNVPAC